MGRGGGGGEEEDEDDEAFIRKGLKGKKSGRGGGGGRKRPRATTSSAKSGGGGGGEVGDRDTTTPGMAAFYGYQDSLPPRALAVAAPTGALEYFEIGAGRVDAIRRLCMNLTPPLPLLVEYDYLADDGSGSATTAALKSGSSSSAGAGAASNASTTLVPNLMDGTGPGARPATLLNPGQLRKYQVSAIEKMTGSRRARSGIIVLPCGAGKTLVGITAAITVGKSCMILCPNLTSVRQWEDSFYTFTNVPRSAIVKLTSKDKDSHKLPPRGSPIGCVLLTTYSMIASGGKGEKSRALLEDIGAREWGLQVMDEVHQVVAEKFSAALRLRCHARLGLTATLVREDEKQKNLSFMLGPKLYEANWKDLTKDGFLANVQCYEARCPMHPAYYREYLRVEREAGKDYNHVLKALAVMNPVKGWVMDYLLRLHVARGDKIIVFADSVVCLTVYSRLHGRFLLYGKTKEREREANIAAFRAPVEAGGAGEVMFLSRVGDVALDVPDANVIIQLSAHFGSRLQEAQRMGRILRRSTVAGVTKQSFFYTLTSGDTLEEHYGAKRRRYLADQGYAYKVLSIPQGLNTPSVPIANLEDLRTFVLAGPTEARRLGEEDKIRSTLVQVLNEAAAGEREESAALAEVVGEDDMDGGAGGGTDADAHAAAAAALSHSATSFALDDGSKFSRRVIPSLAGMSGGAGLRYAEYEGQGGEEAEEAAAREQKVERKNAAVAAAAGGGGGGAGRKKNRGDTGTL